MVFQCECVPLEAYGGARTHMILHSFSGMTAPFRWNDLLDAIRPAVKHLRLHNGDMILGLDGPGTIVASALSALTNYPVIFATKSNLARSPKYSFCEPASPRPDVFLYYLRPGMRVVVVDEAIDTGNTLASCIALLEQHRIEIRSIFVLLEARIHDARTKIRDMGYSMISLVEHPY